MEKNRIKELRIKNNLTQQQMAEVLFISQNAYSLIESGKTRLIHIDRINILSEKFQVTPLELGLFDKLYNLQEHNRISSVDPVLLLREELESKNKQITQMMGYINQLISKK